MQQVQQVQLVLVAALLSTQLAFAQRQEFASRFEAPPGAEIIATISARCDQCAWDTPGREAATLAILIDDRYVAHLPLVRPGRADYEVMLGPEVGSHMLRVRVDRETTARELWPDPSVRVERVAIRSVVPGDPEHTALSLAPFLYARANTLGRFSDVPVFMWYEREPTPRGTRYRYSAIFTNEDGGTPTDRLMATWGRTTDIEYVYSVEVDKSGKPIADDFQGPDHKTLAFNGSREGLHPLLWVSTDNNMVRDSGSTRVRYAPAPVAFALDGVSREAVMDAHPWLYALSSQELAREGKIVEDAPPGNSTIPDPRTFVYVEACGEVGRAAIAFEIGLPYTWVRSNRGVAEYTITRDGCFRVATPVAASTTAADIRELRVVAYPRASSNGAPAASQATVRIDRINKVFMLDEHYTPGPSLLKWTGPAKLVVGGKPLDIPVR